LAKRFLNIVCVTVLLVAFGGVRSAEQIRPPPIGAPKGAPPEYTRFDPAELETGFLRLAFGSDMQRFSESEDRVHKFDHQVRFHITNTATKDRSDSYLRVLDDFSVRVPRIDVAAVDASVPPDVIVRLLDSKDFASTLAGALGKGTARDFIDQTNPRCTTRSRAGEKGGILRADIFIVVDKGNDVFLDCAYHETLHALGLMNHADDIPWTTLNQNRRVGYLSVYDLTMLQMLYDRRIRAGMGRAEVETILPEIIRDLK
jgi:hypothetical protein